MLVHVQVVQKSTEPPNLLVLNERVAILFVEDSPGLLPVEALLHPPPLRRDFAVELPLLSCSCAPRKRPLDATRLSTEEPITQKLFSSWELLKNACVSEHRKLTLRCRIGSPVEDYLMGIRRY